MLSFYLPCGIIALALSGYQDVDAVKHLAKTVQHEFGGIELVQHFGKEKLPVCGLMILEESDFIQYLKHISSDPFQLSFGG